MKRSFISGPRLLSGSCGLPVPLSRAGHPRGGTYAALLRTGFTVPARSPLQRWALTPPFHPYLHRLPPIQAVCFLWHFPCPVVSRLTTERWRLATVLALRSPDFPPRRPSTCTGPRSDRLTCSAPISAPGGDQPAQQRLPQQILPQTFRLDSPAQPSLPVCRLHCFPSAEHV